MKIFYFLLFISTAVYGHEWDYRVASSLEELEASPWLKHPEKPSALSREYEGYVEYRTILEDQELKGAKEFYLGKIGDADKAYLNGIQIGQTGGFPPRYEYNMDTERAYFIPETAIKQGRNELKILVYSKFLVNKGFSPRNFQVSNTSQIDSIKYDDELTNNLSKIIIPILCLVLAVVSFPLLAPKHLWNTQVMTFLIGVSSFTLGICRGRILYHYFDMLSVYKLTMASSIFTLWLVTVFMTKECKSRTKFLPSAIGVCLLMPILMSSDLLSAAFMARIWFHVSPFFLLFALYGSIKSNKNLFRTPGLIVLILTNINDNLNDLRIISTVSMLQFGLGFFISCMILDQLLTLKRSWEKFFMKEAQLEIDAAVGKQALQIAHDLRSPVESIRVGIHNMSNIPEEDQQSIRGGLNRIFEICDSLLGQGQWGSLIYNVNDIETAIKEVIAELLYKHQEKNLRLNYFSNELGRHLNFEFDSALLKRTICNLITNAIEATNYEGDVYLTLSVEDNFIKIEIQDNGSGIPSDVNQVFERGFTTKSHGNGLGLSGAKTFIESIGGIITLSRLHPGTLVSIIIPASNQVAAKKNHKGTNDIILIDDDVLVRFNWKRQGLSSNITVHTFENVQDFLHERSKFHLDTPIYIDSNLGHEKGELLSKKLVQSGFRKIILTTGAPERSITNRQWISKIVGKNFETAMLDGLLS